MRTSLIITILLVGLLGTSIAWITSSIYYRLNLDSQGDALQEQLTNRMAYLRHELEEAARELAISLTTDPYAQPALVRADALTQALRGLAQHPAAKSDKVSVTKLYLLSTQFAVLAGAPRDRASTKTLCTEQRTLAERRRGEERLRIFSGTCLLGDKAYYSAIVPLGMPDPHAYLQVVMELPTAVQGLERALGIPLRLTVDDAVVLYESKEWAAAITLPDAVQVRHEFPASASSSGALVLHAVKDIGVIQERFEQARHSMIMMAVAAIVLIAIAALVVLQRTTIAPLERLTAQLRRIRDDKDQLGQPVDIRGNAEVVELAQGFNAMTAQLKELYERLELMAFTDPLTRLPNRALFQDRLQQLILSARREQKSFALFIMDLDHFKEVNDTLGHPAGDRLLQEVAVRLRAKLRESDTVARLGGDEFAVLLPTVTQPHAAMAARMLLQALRTPLTIDGHSLDVDGSIGVALYPDHGADPHVLLQHADIAMYAAKQAHTGYAFYDTRLDHHHPARLTLLGELRRAIEQEQFELHFQPVVNLWTNRVSSAEALLRWRHPREGLLLPESFVPLLEQTGLIRSLTPWIVNEALRMAARLRASEPTISVSVNLSARDLQDPDLTTTLQEMLAAHQATPEWIGLEITESAVMTDPERAHGILVRLAEMGFRIAIDDFGTGYSSLAYLKKLPVRILKIDKSFVIDMATDADDAAIVRTSVELGHNLGLEVIAEGVESAEVLQSLSDTRCDAAQGLHISGPMAADDFLAWLPSATWVDSSFARRQSRG